MKILGVDPGSRITGYGFLLHKDKKLHYLASGCIKPPSKDPFIDRLHHIYTSLTKIIIEYSPDALALEDIFVAKDPKSAIKLGQVRGAIMIAAKNCGVDVIEYPPTKIKLALVGNGHAEKKQVSKMVELILNIKGIKSPDESDALAVAICHGNTMRYS